MKMSILKKLKILNLQPRAITAHAQHEEGFHSEEGGDLEGMIWRREVCLEGWWFGGGRGF